MNHQEDYLINNIDLASQGFTPEMLSDKHFELLEYASFYQRHAEVCFRIAEMSLGKTDQDLLLQISSLAIRYAIAKRHLRRFLAENGVDKHMALLFPRGSSVRTGVEACLAKMKLIRRKQDGLKECLRSRECLRDTPKLIALYLEARGIGASRTPLVMKWLRAHYPEQ